MKLLLAFSFVFYLVYGCFFYNNKVYAENGLSQLSGYMDYLAARDAVISKNIANIDTPGYLPSDIEKPRENIETIHDIGLTTTNSMHIETNPIQKYELVKSNVEELKPNKNGVNLEQELLNKNENTLKMQEIANLYSKTRGMLRLAIAGK